jgi:hypothetical protein
MGISFYNARGEFTSMLSGDEPVIELTKQMSTDDWVDGEWYGKPFYVLTGEVVPRPENPATVSGQTLENVPVPATVIVNGTSYETNESIVELGFSQPGTYAVKVVAWPYLDKEFQVENPA